MQSTPRLYTVSVPHRRQLFTTAHSPAIWLSSMAWPAMYMPLVHRLPHLGHANPASRFASVTHHVLDMACWGGSRVTVILPIVLVAIFCGIPNFPVRRRL